MLAGFLEHLLSAKRKNFLFRRKMSGDEDDMEIAIEKCVGKWQVFQLRRTVDWVYSQLFRSQSTWRGGSGRTHRTSFQEEAWRRYNRRLQEEYEEELDRVERIRHMQSVFNRERNTYKGATRAGGKMVRVNIINISKETIGIGRLRRPSKTGVTTGKRQLFVISALLNFRS